MALAVEPKCLKCGQGRGSVPPPSIVPDRDQIGGVYQLFHYPGCVTPYTGEHADQAIYVIGFGTELERIFRRSQKGAMTAYYNSFKPPIPLWHDFAGHFCHDAMRDLFG
jgi:hypothetical protein